MNGVAGVECRPADGSSSGEDCTLEDICLKRLFALLTDGSLADIGSAAVALSSISELALRGSSSSTFARLKESFALRTASLDDEEFEGVLELMSQAGGTLRDTCITARAESKQLLKHFLHLKKGGAEVARRSLAELSISGLSDEALRETYPLEALLAGVDWPKNVDPTRREEFLDDAAFATVFCIDKATFRALDKHRRIERKKAVGLF